MELNGILDALYARYQERQPDSMQYVFPPPATPQQIAAAETALGMRLPDELRALYARHAYMMDAWDGVSINPVQSIAASRQGLENVASDMAADAAQGEEPAPEPFVTARGPVAPLVYAPARIPFASQNCRDLLIDLQPPPGGTPGQIVRLDIEDGTIEVVASSLTAFFAQGLEVFSNQDSGTSGEPGWLMQQLMKVAGLAAGLVMFAASVLLVTVTVTWSALSIAAESLAGLLRRKQ